MADNVGCIEQLKNDNMLSQLALLHDEIKREKIPDETRKIFSSLANLTLDCLNLQRYMIDKSIEDGRMIISMAKSIGSLINTVNTLKNKSSGV